MLRDKHRKDKSRAPAKLPSCGGYPAIAATTNLASPASPGASDSAGSWKKSNKFHLQQVSLSSYLAATETATCAVIGSSSSSKFWERAGDGSGVVRSAVNERAQTASPPRGLASLRARGRLAQLPWTLLIKTFTCFQTTCAASIPWQP